MYPSKTSPERRADGIVHAVSLSAFAIASVFLLNRVMSAGNATLILAVLVYVISALASVGISFAYHLHPRHELRPALRRWDHSAIYIVIAGTFTPLLLATGSYSAMGILALIWLFALAGVWFKVSAAEIDSRWSLMSYLALGWFALAALPDFLSGLPLASTLAVVAGGVFYTIGTLFYKNKEMAFRYPIWHAFGTLGGTAFLTAIWVAVA
ncbi:PAQR family membrane homeostasis protein TrhA [Qipengyuania flava]|uniref:PAQR family membrane homeostasis protein TrhA n=1 Tax=Qipengyuania flava TaxID=192812 RepID=UPI001C625FE1|nr:hemolysin III family protein [Qipengyuania flava]QYJ06348.1 hemolysin III family protein [Qipengyuania flava]